MLKHVVSYENGDRAFVLAGLVCSALMVLAYVVDVTPVQVALSALMLLTTLFRPVWGLAVFILLLPIFGNKPATTQFHWLLVTGASLNLALAIRWLWAEKMSPDNSESVEATLGRPSMLLLLMYTLVSLGSLTSLPWKQLLLEFQSAGGVDFALFPYQLRSFFNTTEATYAYSVLTVLLTFQSVLTAFFVHRDVLRESRHAVIFGGSLLAGLVLTLIVGLLDFYRVVDLGFLRPLDPNINPDGRHLRLQSFWGHSGWLAEYIVLCAPFALILLSLKIGFRVRVLFVAMILWLSGFVLILTYQRGGWVSYPPTLLLIIISVGLVRAAEVRRSAPLTSAKRLALRALAVLSIVLLLSIGAAILVTGLGNREGGQFGHSERPGIARYIVRLTEIKETWERTVFIRAGLRLGLLHPFYGGGSEGFYYLYEKEFLKPGGRYVDDPIPLGTLYGTAHNVYAQVFSGKGLWGLLLLLLPVMYLMAAGLRAVVRERDMPARTRLMTLICFSSCGAFLVYGNMQEFFYIQSLQYVFFITLAIFSATLAARLTVSPRHVRAWWCFLVAGFVAHLAWEYVSPGAAGKAWRERPAFGCYEQVEADEMGRPFNWCGQSFRQSFRVADVDGQPTAHLNLHIINPHRPASDLVSIKIEAAGREIARYTVPVNNEYQFNVVIPTDLRGLILNGSVPLKVTSDKLFVPARDIEGSRDFRLLSMMKLVEISE
ncbi:MAG: O-antigen ligase family protein [Pyrinomonadaceae bacterium]|nr:O-antigen ligase family protein [Pyrinomonadaceae bacterium]